MPAPGWYDDPTGRHDLRYWTGALWSRRVQGNGRKWMEPPEATPATSTGYVYSLFDDEAPPPRRVRSPRRRRVLAVLVVLAGLVAAGAAVLFVKSPEASERDRQNIARPMDPVVAALVQYLDDRSAGTGSEADRQCMAEKIVEAVGKARLVEVGVIAGADPLTSLTPEEIQAGLPTVFSCLDDESAVAFMTAAFSPAALGKMNLQSADCVVQGWWAWLGRDKIVELFAIWAAQLPLTTASLDDAQVGILADVIVGCTAQEATTAATAPTAAGG